MSYSTFSNWGPNATPNTIKRLILITCLVTIFSAALQTIFDQFNLTHGPQYLLSLSWHGLAQGYIWQPLTYFFVLESSPSGLTFYYLFSLAFNMYILWILGTAMIDLIGSRSFLRFYLFSGIAIGLVALLLMPFTGDYARLATNTPVILALLTAWSMAFAEAEILLFFVIPIKAKWLIVGLMGALTLVALSHLEFSTLGLYVTSVCMGYAYATMAWGWRSPFQQTQGLDNWLIHQGMRLRYKISKWQLPSFKKNKQKRPDVNAAQDKIVDLNTGKAPTDDDAFIDQMLTKISKHGESSLTWHEKQRMQQISQSKLRK